MRILHVHSGNLYGGVETILAALARHQDLAPQMQPHFALCFEGRLFQELVGLGANVTQLGALRVRHPVSVMNSRRVLRNLLDNGDFAVSICHSGWSRAMFGPVLRSAGLPLVGWFHDANVKRNWLDRLSDRTPIDLAVCNSEFTANNLAKWFPHLHKEVVYCPVTNHRNGLDQDPQAIRREFQTPLNAIVIVQASRMEQWKGHTLLLQALETLKDVPNWICWIIGGSQRPPETEYLEKLKTLSDHLAISDRIRFLGQRSDVPMLLRAADIYCQPNLEAEPFGIALVEALYARLPIVTSALGGACEIVNESCGIVVAPKDRIALSSALRSLILEQSLRAKLGAAGPQRAESLCGPAHQMNRIAEVLRSVARQKLTV